MSDYPDTPITREEQYLAAGLDGGDLPDPITREERYLYEIATKMQGGGSEPVLETLTVTANGTYTPDAGVDGFDEVVVDVDGNPNYVETIEGTLFSPFGNYTRDGLLSGIDAGEITAILTVSLDGKEYIMPGQRHAKVLSFSRLVRLDVGTGSPSYLAAVSVTYQSSGFNTTSSSYYSSGSWIVIKEEDAKETPCTLTIIHHPLPDSE